MISGDTQVSKEMIMREVLLQMAMTSVHRARGRRWAKARPVPATAVAAALRGGSGSRFRPSPAARPECLGVGIASRPVLVVCCLVYSYSLLYVTYTLLAVLRTEQARKAKGFCTVPRRHHNCGAMVEIVYML